MSSSVEDSQHTTAPSQFAHFSTIEPTTTSTGVIPHQALLDAPLPNQTPSAELERSQRTRKPSQKKIEGCKQASSNDQSVVSKGKGKRPTTANSNGKNKNTRNTGNQESSGLPTSPELRLDDIDLAGEDTQQYVSPSALKHLEDFLEHSVSHLSASRLKALAQTVPSLPSTQTFAMETQGEPTQEITQSGTRMGLAGGDDEVSLIQKEMQIPQAANGTGTTSAQKRHIDTLPAFPTSSKRARITTPPKDGSATEEESESDSDTQLRRKRSSDTETESESDSDVIPISRYTAFPPKPSTARPRMVPPAKSSTPKYPSWSKPQSNVAPRNLASSSTFKKIPPAPVSRPANQSPPANLDDTDALVLWALKLAEDQAKTFNQSQIFPPLSGSEPERRNGCVATNDQVTQAIARYRSQAKGEGSSKQPSQTHVPSSLTSASEKNDDAVEAVSSTSPTVKRNGKPKLSDFPGRIGEIASAAIPRFLALVIARGSYEDIDTFRSWAGEAFQETFELEAPEDEYEPAPKVVLTIMVRRVTWLRGKIKERIRAIIQYGYGFRNPCIQRSDIKHNKRLAKKLKPHLFHCRSLKPKNKDQYEHPEFVRAICAALFWDSDAIGLVYNELLNPIPIPGVALVLTMMQACIQEWELGYFKPHDLDIEAQQVDYENHLLSLYEYEKTARSRLTRYRADWFKEGMVYSGSTFENDSLKRTQPYIQASDVRPDTPPPQGDDDEV
ncbi:hypothetical protein RhiJN_17221 [Ceratobasidium sp. AG-Ba]|nr:hypothetical protein RhiJN_17221 [Ceratobasidium sp. AG-Ba]